MVTEWAKGLSMDQRKPSKEGVISGYVGTQSQVNESKGEGRKNLHNVSRCGAVK
jgi:hypothetical protein